MDGDINDLKPQSKPTLADIMAEIGGNRKELDRIVAGGRYYPGRMSQTQQEAIRLLQAANQSKNPDRWLESLNPYDRANLEFNINNSNMAGYVDKSAPNKAVVQNMQEAFNTVPHELTHTLQMNNGAGVDLSKDTDILDRARSLSPEMRKSVFPSANRFDNPLEAWANINSRAHNVAAEGGDFINSPEGRALFTDQSSQRDYYTKAMPGVNSATPDTGTFVPNNESFMNKAKRVMGFADGGMITDIQDPATEAIKDTVRDPQANQMLNLDLAKLAVMNQPQRMASGGIAHMDRGGVVDMPYDGISLERAPDTNAFSVNSKPASQAYTALDVPILDESGNSRALPQTSSDLRMAELSKQLDNGIKPDWMTDTDFAQEQVKRGRGQGHVMKTIGDLFSGVEHLTGSSMGLDPTMGLIGKTGEIHRVPGAARYMASLAAPELKDMAALAADMYIRGKAPGMVAPASFAVAPSEMSNALRTAEEQSVIDKFGQKHKQEAIRAKKVEKAAADELAQESSGKSPEESMASKSKGKNRGAVPADFYRTMAQTQGDEAVIKAAQAGEHLKPTSSGYTGAPRTVTSPQGLGAMRRAIDKDFIDSVEAVNLADPERLGTWYDRAKQGIGSTTEPYQLNRVLEQHGVYSAGVSPESELAFALKHLNSRAAGEPAMAYRGAGMRTLDKAVAEDRPANLGFKIGEYASKNDPRVANEGLFGVNDFRRAQGMGYTDPQGNPWKAGVSTTMHPFMDAETALQVDRANAANIGGRSDWAGPHIQEVPWVYGKAQDFYGRGKRGRYSGDELEGIKQSLADANNTARDYMYKHSLSATHEAIPGASLNHVPQALDMTPAEKLEYSRKGRWDRPIPEAGAIPGVGEDNRDVLYGALGYRQLPSIESQGFYTNKLGGIETNPMTIARPLMDFPTGGGGGKISPLSDQAAQAVEQFRALNSAQEAGAFNLPNTMNSVKSKNSMVLDTRHMNPNKLQDPTMGVPPTAEQLSQMSDLMGDHGFGVSATTRGVSIFPFDPNMNPKDASKVFKKTQAELERIYPSNQMKGITTTGYVPGVGKRNGLQAPVSTEPYSGEATSDMLSQFAKLHPKVALDISESEAVRSAIREQALRDSLLGRTRGDIQKTRQFFSEADWPRAVEMIRKGATPAAAMAALGYSASSMAGEKK